MYTLRKALCSFYSLFDYDVQIWRRISGKWTVPLIFWPQTDTRPLQRQRRGGMYFYTFQSEWNTAHVTQSRTLTLI